MQNEATFAAGHGWVFAMAQIIFVCQDNGKKTDKNRGKNQQKLWCSYFISLCFNIIAASCRSIL